MNQIVAFLNPTALPNVAGAGARANGAADAGEGFAALLAQLQALAGNAGAATAGVTPEQFQNLLGSAVATTQTSANTIPSIAGATTPSDTQGAQTLLDLLAALGTTNKDSTPKSVLPAADSKPGEGLVAQLAMLQAVLQNVQAQTPETTGSGQSTASTAEAITAAQIGLRGTLTPPTSTQPAPTPNDKSAKAEANAAVQAAIVPTAEQIVQDAIKAPANGKQITAPKRPAATQQAKESLAPTETQAPAKDAKPSDGATNAASTPVSANSATQPPANDKPANAQQQPVQAPQASVASVLPNTIAAQHFEVTVATAPQTAVPLDALAVNIARKFEAGSNQFEIRLHPAELGKLEISMSVADDGRVTAVLRAERPETLEMLQRDAKSLEGQLRQAGLDVGSNALSFSLSNGNNNGRQAPFPGWPAFAEANDTADAAQQEAASKYVAVRVRDGIDIRV